ncbi:AhpC/TSA family protein [Rubripirellula obstinata]|uniref:AhpC/TSA family protein n=1 Tax=Rubripirellula obstinata TaxID=406547 RepID=A0A5B1CH21_9BACT|nr:SelL-related redox protein [Rubripirellula obstinata]KAA1258504.1 AhpC/TSA family protein [Rubripirellula obstinata]
MTKPELTEPVHPRWMSITLAAAAVYNLVWGAWIVLRPNDLFVLTGIEPPNYPGIWQCVGMIVGVYGVGYGIAATNPLRHWPITLVGFLGKILGPIGFVYTMLVLGPGDPGYLPPSWGLTIVTNDLIWWIPFAAILYQAFKHHNAPEYRSIENNDLRTVDQANQLFVTQDGVSLADLSRKSPLMMLFLRHSGCTFCREALNDLSSKKNALIAAGVVPVLVHQGDPAKASADFASYGLGEIDHVSDPQCQLYRAYDLQRGKFLQLFGPSVWWRGFKAAILARHGVGKLDGDGFQMPGAFLVKDSQIIKEYRHQTAADLPDVCELAINQ